jgi:SagB-type dehydrogenase family enzyme
VKSVPLPEPAISGGSSVEAALAARRSVRDYASSSLSLAQVAQLLWAAQGITGDKGERTAPSAGALYPLEVYLVAGDVKGLAPGVYHYRAPRHDLLLRVAGDHRVALADAALDQRWIADAPAVIAIAAVPQRTTRKYGRRGIKYVDIEVGHAAQNVYLQAVSMGLGTAMVGAFRDAEVRSLLELRDGEQPLALLPVGRPR